MTLHIIGLGLGNEKDITLRGLEAVKKCDIIYLESYTSILQCKVEDLGKLFGKKIILASRELVEADNNEILKNSKTKNVALLVVGDPFSATTHIDLFLRAKKEKIEIKIVNNASILTSVGITGLQLYKFGKTASIPINNENVESPYDVLKANLSLGLHTLFLLDLEPSKDKFLSINDAINYLLRVESKRKENVFAKSTLCVGCARIGSENSKIRAGIAESLLNYDFGEPPYCLVVPGNLHFMESDALRIYYDYIKPS